MSEPPFLQPTLRQLVSVWADFDSSLNNVPFIERMNRGKLRLEDYQLLLLNLRQQVVEGGRWISRAASNISADYFELRSLFMRHAVSEHRDFRLIEQNYVSIGGTLTDIQSGEKNIGSEALSAWMFHRASQENPFDLLGAMFIIEGLGANKAADWASSIQKQLGLQEEQVSFFAYHGKNDENHLDEFEKALRIVTHEERYAKAIVKTAKVTARLYLLQLSELGNV